MRLERPNALGKTAEATATNRPMKIAYLVPFDDAPRTHVCLDAVFHESYTRWGGMFTLIIPTSAQEFAADGYEEWLTHYDPDFIYSYIDLDPVFIDKIDRLCCPIALIKHKKWNRTDRELDWHSFLPHWDRYVHPISSISTVHSSISHVQLPHQERPREPVVFTQYRTQTINRFIADNFGTAFSLNNALNPIPGLFKTLCLTPPDLPANMAAGTERCLSTLEAFSAISDHKATPVARFAMANSAGIPRPQSMDWTSAYRIFIGTAPLDRIHFWNSRHLGGSWSDTPNALILEPSFLDEEPLVRQLGQYLNKNNYIENGNGPYQAEIHSSSIAINDLEAIRDKLQPNTWSTIRVSRSFNLPAIPSKQDVVWHNNISNDTTIVKLTDDFSEISAAEPSHFFYTPIQFRGLMSGQWIVELSIQRHNSLSKYSNVIDSWSLPRRRKIARAFTDRLAKPTLSGQLALVPSSKGFQLRKAAKLEPKLYELCLPTDETFFRHLVLDFYEHPEDDMRATLPKSGYANIATSDKGQNLRGVISLLGDLSTAFNILTNKYWRTVLAKAQEDSTRPLTFDWDKLFSLIPNDKNEVLRLTKELRFANASITKEYLKDCLRDTLEHLIRSNVFHQISYWRCNYCGHLNIRTFDKMKIKNECDICEDEHFTPIDIEWKYKLNDFVYHSLQKNSGLPVLWTLGFLQDRLFRGAFWHLPEVDLYEKNDSHERNNEIDILCMLDGKFHAVEVKLSASTFLNKTGAVEKFVKIIKLLNPDTAILAFERYCVAEDDVDATRTQLLNTAETIRAQIGHWTKLEILVAEDVPGFNDFHPDLGWFGPRASKYNQ